MGFLCYKYNLWVQITVIFHKENYKNMYNNSVLKGFNIVVEHLKIGLKLNRIYVIMVSIKNCWN